MATLTYFTVTGTYFAAVADAYDTGIDPELVGMNGTVTFTPLISSGDTIKGETLTPPQNLVLAPIKATVKAGQIWTNGTVGVKLVANTSVLGLSGDLYYRVDFGDGLLAAGRTYPIEQFDFLAPTISTTVDLVEVTPATGQPATGPVPTSAVITVNGRTGYVITSVSDLSDASTLGQALAKAVNQDAAWTALGQVPTANLPSYAYTKTIGDGVATSIPVTHSKGTRNVMVGVYDATTFEEVNCDKVRTTDNTVTLGFATAPALNSLVAVVIAAGSPALPDALQTQILTTGDNRYKRGAEGIWIPADRFTSGLSGSPTRVDTGQDVVWNLTVNTTQVIRASVDWEVTPSLVDVDVVWTNSSSASGTAQIRVDIQTQVDGASTSTFTQTDTVYINEDCPAQNIRRDRKSVV